MHINKPRSKSVVIKSEKITKWGRVLCEKWLLIRSVPKVLEHFEFYFAWIEILILNLHQTCLIVLYGFVEDEYVFPAFRKFVMGINPCYNIISSIVFINCMVNIKVRISQSLTLGHVNASFSIRICRDIVYRGGSS